MHSHNYGYYTIYITCFSLTYESLKNTVLKELWLYKTTAINIVNIYNFREKFNVMYCRERFC